MDAESIILAIGSPPGASVRGVIRLSGAGTITVIAAMTRLDTAELRSRRALASRLVFDRWSIACLLIVMPAPASYTGEDVVEILLPGNPILLSRVIDESIVLAADIGLGARRAKPGEFTARAFLNGRLSLTQAEGVAAIVAAHSDAELRAANLLAEGSLGRVADELSDLTADALALVEAGIDFTDEDDVVAITPAQLLSRLDRIDAALRTHLGRAVGTESLRSLPLVVLAGPPNAGKSTLFNSLLGHQRAVVSDVAGTTRDVLIERLTLEGSSGTVDVLLADAAGRVEAIAADAIESGMQAATGAAVGRADIVLQCAAADSPGQEATGEPVDLGLGREILRVRTKIDMAAGTGARHAEAGRIAVSACTGEGLAVLRRAIVEALSRRRSIFAADALALQPRHEAALRAAAAHVQEAIDLLRPRAASATLAHAELLAAILRSALDELGQIAGMMTPDDVLGRIFSRFCIGK